MNFYNEIRYVDLEVSCLGALYMDDFEYLIKDITETGGTYRFIVYYCGKPLTKKGIPFDSILFTIRDNALHLAKNENLLPKGSPENDANIKELSSFIGTEGNRFSEDEVKDMLKSARVMLVDGLMVLDLQMKLETMIQESDYLNNIYLEKNITRDDLFANQSLCFDLENLSLAYFKSSV